MIEALNPRISPPGIGGYVMRPVKPQIVKVIGLAASLAMQVGCDVDFGYLLPAAAGQLELIQKTIPIDEAISSGNLTTEQIAKLELIRDVRAFAATEIGLNVENNYTMFYDAGDQPVAINVSASRKDRLAPKLWSFPIVGTVPYLGFFDVDAAMQRRAKLESEDWDVFTYEIDAYSAVGFFPNPVLSPMLERDDISLVDTVLHELLHSTVWRSNDTPFNESLATFVGRHGAESYFASRFPDQTEFIQTAFDQFEDVDRFSQYMLEVVGELEAYYDSELSSNTKITGREEIVRRSAVRFMQEVLPLMNHPDPFDWVGDHLPVNNAWFLGIRRYNLDLSVFEAVFEATGHNWPASIQVFRQAAADASPYQYLRQWAVDHADVGSSAAAKSVSDNGVRPSPNSHPPVQRGPCSGTLHRTLIATE